MRDITDLHVQREIKPKIEDLLPHYLDGETFEAASDFARYMQTNKMTLRWAGIHNAWKAAYKGKPILYIRLNCKYRNEDKYAKWVITPYLINLKKYEDEITKEGLRDFVLNGFWRCQVFAYGVPCGNGCAPGTDKTILGKELKNLCHGNFYSGRNWVWFYDPDEMAINCIKKLLDLEKQARDEKVIEKK